MDNFKKNYETLLARQVEEEINYLVQHGHDSALLSTPCMFCTLKSSGHYICRRLIELRQFRASIASQGERPIGIPVNERLPIGQAIPDPNTAPVTSWGNKLHISDMPLMHEFRSTP